jgi:outer membrane protein assembly factor BamB
MKRFAALAAALVIIQATVSAQMPARITSRPTIPTTEALNRVNLKLAWKAFMPMDGKRDGIATVQVLGNEMYVQLRSGAVIALNAETGQKLWHARYADPYKPTFRLGHNHNTIFQSSGTHVYAFDRPSGQLAWVWDMAGQPTAAPVADAEQLYLTMLGNKVRVYDLLTIGSRDGPPPGTEAYVKAKKDDEVRKATASESTPKSRTGYASQSKVGERGMASAIAQGPYSGVGTSEAINNWSLRLVWSYTGEGRIDQSPLLAPRAGDDDGWVLMAGHDGSAVVSSKASSRDVTKTDIGSAISAPSSHLGGTAYIPTESGAVVAMNIEFSRPVWRVGLGGHITERPAITDEDVYAVASRGGLHRIDRDKGNIIWRNSKAEHFLAATKKVVYALDKLGNLLLIDRARGTDLSSVDTRDFTVPIQNDYTDRAYLAADDGLIFCVRDRENAKPIWNKKYQEEKPVLKKTPEDKEREAIQKEKDKEGMKKEEEKKEDKKKDAKKEEKKDN